MNSPVILFLDSQFSPLKVFIVNISPRFFSRTPLGVGRIDFSWVFVFMTGGGFFI